jgi:DNA modification methylase
MSDDSLKFSRPSTPKRRGKPEAGRGGWYSYYAGYPSVFVRDVLTSLALQPQSVVLDPWLGSGTTTQIAHEFGLQAHGYDVNPAMVIVAKARLLGPEVSPSEVSLCRQIVEHARDIEVSADDDPLSIWLGSETIAALRSIERAVFNLLVTPDPKNPGHFDPVLEGVSSLAAFFYVALFRTGRELLDRFRSSNPTWLRLKVPSEEKLTATWQHVAAVYWKHVTTMAAAQFQLLPEERQSEFGVTHRIQVGSSVALPDEEDSVQAVFGSPPYCTRIDYAMATYPELALLKFDRAAIGRLRRDMIGTATVEEQVPEIDPAWGKRAGRLLRQVYDHQSYASRSYYYKNMVQYFVGLSRSLAEIDRVLKPNGDVVLVVQDSRFKDLHIDLQEIVTDMGSELGWSRHHRFNYASGRHLGRINTRSNSTTRSAIESVLHFSK